MRNFRRIIAAVVLVCSIVLLSMRLFTPQTIQITLESGREITTEGPEYYTMMQVLLLVVSAFLMGGSATYLYYNSDIKNGILPGVRSRARYAAVTDLLKRDEKKAFLLIAGANGEMLQNRLVEKMGLSKVKVTRILMRLEKKGLITRTRHGLTNKIKVVEII
jgi:uncharacterized membrane protein